MCVWEPCLNLNVTFQESDPSFIKKERLGKVSVVWVVLKCSRAFLLKVCSCTSCVISEKYRISGPHPRILTLDFNKILCDSYSW